MGKRLFSTISNLVKVKIFLKTNSKYYLVDIGLRYCLTKSSESDIGHILENIVFLELKRRGYDVYVGQLDDGEIDFVAVKGNDISYYQVSATLDENTLNRELAPFKKVGVVLSNNVQSFNTPKNI